MKKITFSSVNLVINSVQVSAREQGQGPATAAGTASTGATTQHFLNVNGSFPELGGLGFYRDFPITEAEATGQVPLVLAEKLIKAEFAKFLAASAPATA